MRSIVDSPAMDHIERLWPEFARDPRNLRLGLASDGVSPYSIKSSTYSIWPVALINYNIPPWLATKKGFVILALILPGPKQTKKFDVFLEPLVEELKQLCQGVDDMFDGRSNRNRIGRDRWFTLKGILMWTMHDYPGYEQVSGLQTKGYRACPTCAEGLPSAWSSHLRKIVYMNYSTFLPMDHPMRGSGVSRNNNPSPQPVDVAYWDARWNDVQDGRLPLAESGLRRWSILHELPYWKDLLIRHLLDPMHIEANVVKALVKHLYGEKDTVPARWACEELLVHPNQWIQTTEEGRDVMPHAPWVLQIDERKILSQRIGNIRKPTRFGSCLRKAFKDDKPRWPSDLKTHDLHVLLQHILPTCLHGLATEEVRQAIYDLATLMRCVCSKEIHAEEISGKRLFAVETLCRLELVPYMPRERQHLQNRPTVALSEIHEDEDEDEDEEVEVTVDRVM
ncbi:hypothetical protein R1sor_025315 [Riccia sorocarpa]|uniref:Transposase n=1 Tax=Riccia sorocarpa TaxID=122646 RepID=A0ABD3GB11_9MARC